MGFAFDILNSGDVFVMRPDCRLRCVFCSYGKPKRLLDQGILGRIRFAAWDLLYGPATPKGRSVDEFERRVKEGRKEDGVCLSGWDIFECDELFSFMEVCRKHGRKIRIVSPGLMLADPDFARRVAEYRPEITITYLSTKEDVYAKIAGVSGVKALVEKAIENLSRLGLHLCVNCVLTRHNCDDLMNVAETLFGRFGLGHFSLLNFCPDKEQLRSDREAGALFAEFELLDRELRRFIEKYAGTDKRIVLRRIPPCKVNEKVLTCGRVVFSVNDCPDPAHPVYRHPNCGSCRWAPKCFFVSVAYQNGHPDEEYPHEKVNRVFGKILS